MTDRKKRNRKVDTNADQASVPPRADMSVASGFATDPGAPEAPDSLAAHAPEGSVKGCDDPTLDWRTEAELGPDQVYPEEVNVLARLFGTPTVTSVDWSCEFVTPRVLGGDERRQKSLELAAATACQLIQEATARALVVGPTQIEATRTKIEQVLEVMTGATTMTRAMLFLAHATEFDPDVHPGVVPWDPTHLPEMHGEELWVHFLDRFPTFEAKVANSETGHVTEDVRERYAEYVTAQLVMPEVGRPSKDAQQLGFVPRTKALYALARAISDDVSTDPRNFQNSVNDALRRVTENLRTR